MKLVDQLQRHGYGIVLTILLIFRNVLRRKLEVHLKPCGLKWMVTDSGTVLKVPQIERPAGSKPFEETFHSGN